MSLCVSSLSKVLKVARKGRWQLQKIAGKGRCTYHGAEGGMWQAARHVWARWCKYREKKEGKGRERERREVGRWQVTASPCNLHHHSHHHPTCLFQNPQGRGRWWQGGRWGRWWKVVPSSSSAQTFLFCPTQVFPPPPPRSSQNPSTTVILLSPFSIYTMFPVKVSPCQYLTLNLHCQGMSIWNE